MRDFPLNHHAGELHPFDGDLVSLGGEAVEHVQHVFPVGVFQAEQGGIHEPGEDDARRFRPAPPCIAEERKVDSGGLLAHVVQPDEPGGLALPVDGPEVIAVEADKAYEFVFVMNLSAIKHGAGRAG